MNTNSIKPDGLTNPVCGKASHLKSKLWNRVTLISFLCERNIKYIFYIHFRFSTSPFLTCMTGL